ncbi:hypothetical protein [Modestobacter sp. SYSU DS0875]
MTPIVPRPGGEQIAGTALPVAAPPDQMGAAGVAQCRRAWGPPA